MSERNEKQVQAEFKKLRRVIHGSEFSYEQKERAWGMLLGIQWMRKIDCGLTLLELLNADLKQIAVVKRSDRK